MGNRFHRLRQWLCDDLRGMYLLLAVKMILVLGTTILLALWDKDVVVHYMGF